MNQLHRDFMLMALAGAGLMFAPDHSNAQTAARPILIPGVFHRWALPGEASKPETTIEQIEKCLGSDYRSHDLIDALKNDGAALEQENREIIRQAATLQATREKIDIDNTSQSERILAFNNRVKESERRRLEIEKARGTVRNAAEAKAFNEQIALFNVELANLKLEKAKLDATATPLAERIATFNVELARSNENVTAYNVRVSVYQAKAEQLNGVLSEFNQRCTGERRLVK